MTTDKELSRLGALIKAKRQEVGIGLRKAAEQSGISPSTLSRLERNIGAAPDAETMAKLAQWLNASIDDLLFGGKTQFKETEGLSTPDIIEVHLRADKKLAPETAQALAQLFRAAYTQFAKEDEEQKE